MTEPNSSIEFASWPTIIAHDHVEILSTAYDAIEGRLEVVMERDDQRIIATFIEVVAFRLLDEGGLTELWAAEDNQPRPAFATFRVRGHGWSRESPIPFIHGTDHGWSFVIATITDCVEVLTRSEPRVELG